ncbi:MAG: YjgN family protein [Aestuariivirgaceae bacterium]
MTTLVDSQVERPARRGVPIAVTYVPRPGLASLAIINFLLMLVTLSLYRFWAKTKVRRHIWSCIHINGEPLEYTGTGKELFLGALIVFLLLILPIILILVTATVWLGQEHPVTGLLQTAVTVLVLLLTGMAIYRARRYRLSRTLWRGIRGTLVGSSWRYSLLYFGSWLLKIFTLGWSTPAMNVELQQRITRDMRFGETPFTFKGSAGRLYPAYALCWFLVTIVVLFGFALGSGVLYSLYYNGNLGFPWAKLLAAGAVAAVAIYVLYFLAWTIYQAREMNAFAAYTGFDAARFRLTATAASLSALWLGNLFILLFTIGIGMPFILQRNVRYLCDRLTVDGTVDVESIRQSRQPLGKRGEGLADAFDIDSF